MSEVPPLRREDVTLEDVPNHPNLKRFNVKALIRDTVTGFTVVSQQPCFFYEGRDEWDDYAWRDGNQSCDCNRRDYFLLAMGFERCRHAECGHGRFLANLYTERNRLFYKEFEPTLEQLEKLA